MCCFDLRWTARRRLRKCSSTSPIPMLLAFLVGLFLSGPAGAQPTTTRVSVSSTGGEGDDVSGSGPSFSHSASITPPGVAISGDGRWVAFGSFATNLYFGWEGNTVEDVFVHDRQTGTTRMVSVGVTGAPGDGPSGQPVISSDGRWVAFMSATTSLVPGGASRVGIYVRDLLTNTTTRASVGPSGVEADEGSASPAISGDGRYVAFVSEGTNLVPGDTNWLADIFVHDRASETTSRVSVGTAGAQANGVSADPVISTDGRWVAFVSRASNLVPNDTNGVDDIFLHDRQTGTTSRVSVGTGLAQLNTRSPERPAISADGRWVSFENYDAGYVGGRLLLHDRLTMTTADISVGPAGGRGSKPAISADGRVVAYQSGGTRVFAYDRLTGTTTQVNVDFRRGLPSTGVSTTPAINATGTVVAFASASADLVANDTNLRTDVFVRDQGPPCGVTLDPSSVSVQSAGAVGAFSVVNPTVCAWAAVSSAPAWLAVTSGATGSGNGTVSYSVAVNSGGPRSANVFVGNQVFSVTQSGVDTTLPAAPSGLFVDSVAGNTVTLRWAVPTVGPAPTGFVLEGGVSPGGVLASIPTGSSVPIYTFQAPTGSFYVRMHALSGPLRSPPSNEIRINVNVPVAPSPPSNLLGLVNGSTLALAWTNTYSGGAPTSFVLDVTGSIATSLPLGFGDSFSFVGVPAGSYTLALRAQNAAGTSSTSNAVTLTFPGPCSGPPLAPADMLAYRVGSTVFVTWSSGTGGPAPTGYVLNVTGSFVGSLATSGRAMSGSVGSGAYTLSVVAANACGTSVGTAPQTVFVP